MSSRAEPRVYNSRWAKAARTFLAGHPLCAMCQAQGRAVAATVVDHIREHRLNPQDAETLAARKFQVAELARFFGVPPHLVGDVERSTSWGSGITGTIAAQVPLAVEALLWTCRNFYGGPLPVAG